VRAAPWALAACLVAETSALLAAEPGSPGTAENAAKAPPNEPAPDAAAEPPRALAAALAVVPGVALHGSGHYVLGRRDTAWRLFAAEGLGLGLLIGGVSLELGSGNSRALAGPALVATILGAGLVVASFGADIYGSLATDSPSLEHVPRAPARFESELGYRYVADPRFSYSHFVVERLTLRTGPFRIEPSAWFATSSENVRYRLEGAVRAYGLTPGEPGTKDDHVDVVLAGVHHRFVPEGFARTGGEVALDVRYDLSHLGDTLRGGFVEAKVGYAYAKVDYDVPGVRVPPDTDDALLLATGVGVALRGRAAPGSEARLYYDHRHDDFAAGLLLEGRVSGVYGHLGADLRWYFGPRVGVLLVAEVGAAFVGGLSLLLREGKLPRTLAPVP
jgi:hypothetical protein